MKKRIEQLIISILICLFPLSAMTEEIFFYHTDNFGTPMAMTDTNGGVVWRADELPFGEEYQPPEEIPEQNNRRFLGKELDKETGLIYMGARYMDPKTGRFNRPDPVGLVDPATGMVNQEMLVDPQRHNRYVYGLNNPYRYIDPDGNWAEAVFIEGPSIAVGVHSFVNNIKQGNYGAATLDAGGIFIDSAAALAPGIPGGVGLSIKVSRKVAKPVYKTTKEATEAANKLGFQKINETVHEGQAVFKKGKRYITRDVDGHDGGAWKGAKSVEGLSSRKTRSGTYDSDLNRIGD